MIFQLRNRENKISLSEFFFASHFMYHTLSYLSFFPGIFPIYFIGNEVNQAILAAVMRAVERIDTDNYHGQEIFRTDEVYYNYNDEEDYYSSYI